MGDGGLLVQPLGMGPGLSGQLLHADGTQAAGHQRVHGPAVFHRQPRRLACHGRGVLLGDPTVRQGAEGIRHLMAEGTGEADVASAPLCRIPAGQCHLAADSTTLLIDRHSFCRFPGPAQSVQGHRLAGLQRRACCFEGLQDPNPVYGLDLGSSKSHPREGLPEGGELFGTLQQVGESPSHLLKWLAGGASDGSPHSTGRRVGEAESRREALGIFHVPTL
ncbi:hypothetical protein ACFFX0_02685 [Citricoccus parietis]|uniref:Uncharacterized protein n=1 Tax=Citricoccus parietis TaxID=592307 RepID=A0ABV5FU03_9MICC